MGLLSTVASTKLTSEDLENDYQPIAQDGAILRIDEVKELNDPTLWHEGKVPEWALAQANEKLAFKFTVMGPKHIAKRKISDNIAFAGQFKWVGQSIMKAAGFDPKEGHALNPLDAIGKVVMADLTVYHKEDNGKDYQNVGKYRKAVKPTTPAAATSVAATPTPAAPTAKASDDDTSWY